jgi:hypothetical protein
VDDLRQHGRGRSGLGVRIWGGGATRWTPSACPTARQRPGARLRLQWRHAGAEYIDKDTDYSGFGVDQILNVIDGIKSDPHSRRHVLSAWQVSDLTAMALPRATQSPSSSTSGTGNCQHVPAKRRRGPGYPSTSPATPC